MRYTSFLFIIGGLALSLGVAACSTPKIYLFKDATEPFKEFTLQGKEKGKVVVIPIQGIISDHPRKGLLHSQPSMVEEFVSQLNLAEKDSAVKAVLLKIDSPGGTITASDLLYHEIEDFKSRTGIKIVAVMMDICASGGYYISLPADRIIAHPTTVTGSIGVIFIRPKVTGLMTKIGVEMEVNKSGEHKDMASPFREATEKEEKIINSLNKQLGEKFTDLVTRHRRLDQNALADISTGRIYSASEALQIGLVDEVGYLNDALTETKKLAKLPKDAKVVVYRRTQYPNDNLYNTSTTQYKETGINLIDLGLSESITSLSTGFYYLWLPVAGN
jgi:protease-4